MDLLDATIAQTAAPAIRQELGGSYATIEWTTAAYTLAMATGLLLGGRLGDLFGRRQVLLGGMAAFTGASVLCALAPSPELLIGARALQGLTAAVMVPQCFGLIRELFGDEGQQRAFAIFGPVMGLAAVVGPLLGGAIVDADLLGTGWRAIFLINVPIGLAALVVGRRSLPQTAPVASGARLDLPSVLLAMAGGLAIVYPLVEGRERGWPAWCVALPFAGVALLGAFAALQARRHRAGATTLVEPSLLKRRPYVSGLALVATFIGAMGGMVLALNVMFQTGLGFSPLACGVATAAIPLAAIGGSITSAVIVARLGRIVLWIGTGTMAAGLLIVDLVLRAQGAELSAWDLVAAAGRHRLRHGHDLHADVRHRPGGRRAAPARLGLRVAGVDPAARDVDRHRGRRHRPVRRRRLRPRPRGVRQRRRPRAAGERRPARDRRGHRRLPPPARPRRRALTL